MTAEVVVLGGGYVGVWAARAVLRRTRRHSVRVRLVSMAPHHAFHGWTAEVITGHVDQRRARVPLVQLLPGVEIVHGAVARVDLERRMVDVLSDDGGIQLPYDHLVLGLGSRDALERVPGLAEHGWSLKHDRALPEMQSHLSGLVHQAARTPDATERRRLLHVVVAGGGFTGTEAATAIAQRLRTEMAAAESLAAEHPVVTLLNAGPQLLPSLRPRFGRVADYAAAHVAASGVTVRHRARLRAVTGHAALLEDGTRLPAATVVCALGQLPCVPDGTSDLTRAPDGRLVTDRYLRVTDAVWAGGDCAAVPHPAGTGPCPANALWAIHHGKRIGSNIARVLTGRPPAPFRFPGLGQAASYGVGAGAAEMYGVSLTGWAAWLARWVFFHGYMPSRRVALATVREWGRTPARRTVPARSWEDRSRAARPHHRRSLAP